MSESMALAARGNYTIPKPGVGGYDVQKANFSGTGHDRSIQYNWTVDAHACGRPPTDFDLSIVCIGSGHWSGSIESPGLDYAAFEQCCTNSTTGTNIFTMSSACPSAWCFTNEQQDLPRTWGACYKNAVQDQIEKVRRQNASRITKDMDPENTITRCEYIDFETLKKGLVNKQPKTLGSTGTGRAATHNLGSGTWTIMFGGLAAVLLSQGL